MLKQSTGRRNEDVHLRQALHLVFDVLPADDEAGRERVVRPNFTKNLKDLDRELARRRNDERAQAVLRAPSLAVERLEQRNEEGQGLARPRPGRGQDIGPLERERNRKRLDWRRRLEEGFLETCEVKGGGAYRSAACSTPVSSATSSASVDGLDSGQVEDHDAPRFVLSEMGSSSNVASSAGGTWMTRMVRGQQTPLILFAIGMSNNQPEFREGRT